MKRGDEMLRALWISVVGVVLLSCVLTPPLYSFILSIDPATLFPYSRVFDRVVLVLGALFIFWYRKEFDLTPLKRFFYAGTWKTRGTGILIGMAASFFPALAALFFIVGDESGRLRWHDNTTSYFVFKFLKIVPAALIIAFIEEAFFRVLLFQRLKDKMSLVSAVVLCSAIYSIVHFFSPDRSYVYPGWSPVVGFDYLVVLIDQLVSPGVLGGIAGLFFVGSILCFAIQWSGSVYLAAGLHAGWIVGIKAAFLLTRINPGMTFPEGVGRRYFLAADYWGWGAMGATLIGLLMLMRYRSSESCLRAS